MQRKLISILLSAAIASCILAGCGNTPEADTPVIVEPETIESETPESSEEPTSSEVIEETESSEESEEIIEEENHDNEYRSELTNEWIDLSLKDQRPVAIIVDNEKTALDHYGLTQADIIYELMNSTANNEVTRLLCLVKDWGNITRFGSIRSARPAHFLIAPEYDAIIIHDGGPFYIDTYLKLAWVDNLSGGFARIDNGKPREFTEYVTTGEIAERIESAKYSAEYTSYYEGPHWQFADEKEPFDLSEIYNSKDCTYIDLPFPHNQSELTYDEEENVYLYSEYGMAHIDPENDDKQLSFTNVILQCAEVNVLDANGYMEFKLYKESGKGYYISGGKAIPVTWEKGTDTERTIFYDSNGDEITLNTGKTYIGLVSTKRWSELVLE